MDDSDRQRGNGLWWVIAVAMAVAASGPLAGWLTTQPIYRSTGILRIEVGPRDWIYDGDTFDEIDALLEQVTQSLDTARIGVNAHLEVGGEPLGRSEGLDMNHPRRSELIVVSFRHRNPQLAQQHTVAAVGATKAALYTVEIGERPYRIKVISAGNLPLEPYEDNRMKRAVWGGLATGSLALVIGMVGAVATTCGRGR